MSYRRTTVLLVLFACIGMMYAPSSTADCPSEPCLTMAELAGHWDLLGANTWGVYDLWPYSDRSIVFTANPDRVYGYVGDTLMEESPVSLSCTVLIADPGISPEFGVFRPEDITGTACVRLDISATDPLLWDAGCEPPCMLIQSHSIPSDPKFLIYQWRAATVDIESSGWSTLKALFDN
jgi:hypothetical protein